MTMIKSLVVLSLSAALNLVLASSVTLTSPAANDVWKAGSTVEIEWKVNDDSAGPIRLQYASGPSKALVVNGVIADDVDASAGKYSWKIPSDFKPKRYVIEAGPSANDLSFAGYIRVESDNKTDTKKHTTTTKKSTSTKKPTSTKKTTKKSTKKLTTTTTTKGGKKVCVGYRENDVEKVKCHFVSEQSITKTAKKTTKHKTTKRKTTKKSTTKK